MRRQGAPSRHYPLTGNYPLSSGSAGGDARESFSFSDLLSLSACPFFIRQPEKSWNGRFHCLAGKERRQLEERRGRSGFRKCFNERREREEKKEGRKEREARFARTVHLSVNRWPLGVLPGR